jgi:hypothetical protein
MKNHISAAIVIAALLAPASAFAQTPATGGTPTTTPGASSTPRPSTGSSQTAPSGGTSSGTTGSGTSPAASGGGASTSGGASSSAGGGVSGGGASPGTGTGGGASSGGASSGTSGGGASSSGGAPSSGGASSGTRGGVSPGASGGGVSPSTSSNVGTTTSYGTSGVHYIAGHYIINPIVYNEFNPGLPGSLGGTSLGAHGAAELPFNFGHAFDAMISAQAHQYMYPHPGPQNGTVICGTGNPACVTNIGGRGQAGIRGFSAQDTDYSVHFGLGSSKGRVYLAGAYMQRFNNYNYPTTQGFGFGLEKLADVDHMIAPYGNVYYYPTVGAGNTLRYGVLTYQVGIAFNLQAINVSSMFLDVGWEGDRGNVRTDVPVIAPSDFQHTGFYAGVGLRL